MPRTLNLVLAVVALAPAAIGAARADSYPVSGLWTYTDVAGAGPSKTCDSPTMEFVGDHRWDTGGGVPDYRNVAIEKLDASRYALNDEFLGPPNVRGNVQYTLELLDEDHLVMNIVRYGRTIALRRCV